MGAIMKPPFPFFGGKSRTSRLVWSRLGDVPNYVEPFAGSLAVLLARPHAPQVETVNDKNCLITNYWRAVQNDPNAVARYADGPVNETDLCARHRWLKECAAGRFGKRMATDPRYYDVLIAGWWVWGISCWFGPGWCVGRDKLMCKPLLSCAMGVHKKSLRGRDALMACHARLCDRLRYVRVLCGDWRRVLTPSVTIGGGGVKKHGVLTGVFLDPPYVGHERVHGAEDDLSTPVRAWCLECGREPLLRIALSGYGDEHAELESAGWVKVQGHQQPKFEGGRVDHRPKPMEFVWFSPWCLHSTDS